MVPALGARPFALCACTAYQAVTPVQIGCKFEGSMKLYMTLLLQEASNLVTNWRQTTSYHVPIPAA